MANITSYTTLVAAMGDWLARTDLSTSIPTFIQNWEARFYRQPKNYGRWMEATLSSATSSGVLAVPSDYLAMKYAYVNGSPSSRLDRVSLNQLYGTYPRGSGTGFPVWYARDVGNFVFGPAPDSNYTIKGVYWAKPDAMAAENGDSEDHWLIVNAPDLVLYGALCESAPFVRNKDQLGLWKALYDESIQDYRAGQKHEDQSGSPSQEVLG